MMSTILEAALRSLALAIVAAIISRIFLRTKPRLELTLWTLVLVGAMAMPAAMQRAPIALLPSLFSSTEVPSSAEVPSLGAQDAAQMNMSPSVGAAPDDQTLPGPREASPPSPPISSSARPRPNISRPPTYPPMDRPGSCSAPTAERSTRSRRRPS